MPKIPCTCIYTWIGYTPIYVDLDWIPTLIYVNYTSWIGPICALDLAVSIQNSKMQSDLLCHSKTLIQSKFNCVNTKLQIKSNYELDLEFWNDTARLAG